LYDVLSGGDRQYHSRVISRNNFPIHAASFSTDNLAGVFHYYDAKTNDQKLTQRVAEDAQNNGASFYENTTIESIEQKDSGYVVKSNSETFESPILINATGPWIDEVNQRFSLPAKFNIRKISGIHITLDGLLTQDLMFMQTKEKRIFFVIPEREHNQTIIGTTEREEFAPIDNIKINEEDIEYLLANINNYLKPGFKLLRKNVKDSWIGVRPLIAEADNPTNLTREYELDLHKLGEVKLLHVFGGKLTTYLSLARKVRKVLY